MGTINIKSSLESHPILTIRRAHFYLPLGLIHAIDSELTSAHSCIQIRVINVEIRS